ncbi:penicillin-binding protein 1C [Owenweeksia hongkongensis]|uniref:penicillin-binding protein 1C n=1 Tax=Owenweeksia hongkongensis TaxID=253245 RepID=UPI003A8F45BD
MKKLRRIVASLKFRILAFVALCLWFYFILPSPLFKDSYATVLHDADGNLLSATIADDEQWRFPEVDSLPDKLQQCIQLYEDEYFEWHPGINPVSIGRAFWQNLVEGKVFSGASTISMQVIRLSRKNPPRTYFEKAWEIILAIRLEFSYCKEEILNLYASHAPYGGNVVGAETASWRYFNRPLQQLSWSESAMLAVLPNSPSLIHLGRNRDALKTKRDFLLSKLLDRQLIDTMTYELSLLEEIPNNPKPIPNHGFHLLQKAKTEGMAGQRIYSTIDGNLQKKVNEKVNRYVKFLAQNRIHNTCAIVVSLKDGSVKSYVGNATHASTQSKYVDLIQAQRSSGSILKPFLYAKAIEHGLIHTTTLLKDVPVVIDQFSPSNFDGEFEGVVRANQALAKSLNVPATLLLRDYGLGPFYTDLQKLGFTTIKRPANNYGLSLILGGAEVTLWELAKVYSHQAQLLNKERDEIPSTLTTWQQTETSFSEPEINRGAWWLTTQALTEVQRPGLNSDWKNYTSRRKIAWKTGTSQGFRDAWAVGYDKEHLVAVWVGNADGEGRPGLTGVSTAGPILFEIFELLPPSSWFDEPSSDLKEISLCTESGLLPTPYCPTSIQNVPFQTKLSTTCTYHRPILINEKDELVYRDCAKGNTRDTVLFQLDPIAAYYYYPKHGGRHFAPTLSPACEEKHQHTSFGIIYPNERTDIIIPINLKGELEKVQLKATHVDKNATLYWHLNDHFLGITQTLHEMSVLLEEGSQTLTIMDEKGNVRSCKFRAHVPEGY